MSKIGDHFFEFPASRGTQGDSIVLMLTVPARTLTRVLASDNYGDTLDRSQRELNPARAKKFYQYLVEAYENKEPFIIPPLVGNCDSYVEFEEFGNTNVGVARFPMDAEIKLFDGQHRAAGIAEYCRTIDEPIHVPMMLTLQLPLKTRQQFSRTLTTMYRSHLRLSTWPTTGAIRTLRRWSALSVHTPSFLKSPILSITWFPRKAISG